MLLVLRRRGIHGLMGHRSKFKEIPCKLWQLLGIHRIIIQIDNLIQEMINILKFRMLKSKRRKLDSAEISTKVIAIEDNFHFVKPFYQCKLSNRTFSLLCANFQCCLHRFNQLNNFKCAQEFIWSSQEQRPRAHIQVELPIVWALKLFFWGFYSTAVFICLSWLYDIGGWRDLLLFGQSYLELWGRWLGPFSKQSPAMGFWAGLLRLRWVHFSWLGFLLGLHREFQAAWWFMILRDLKLWIINDLINFQYLKLIEFDLILIWLRIEFRFLDLSL